MQRRLLEATERLLDDTRTFAEISVEEIITEAGIARSTFYAHFEDKGALLVALAENVSSAIEEGASRWYNLPRDATREDLRSALLDMVASYQTNRLLLEAIIEGAAYDARVKQGYRAVIATRVVEMERSFRSQQEDGGLPADLNVTTIAPWIGWMTERGLYQLIGDGSDQVAVEAYIDGLTAIVWRVCYEGTR